jgi:hypothetical protein
MPILGTAGHPVRQLRWCCLQYTPVLAFAVARLRLSKREHQSNWLQRSREPCMQEFELQNSAVHPLLPKNSKSKTCLAFAVQQQA